MALRVFGASGATSGVNVGHHCCKDSLVCGAIGVVGALGLECNESGLYMTCRNLQYLCTAPYCASACRERTTRSSLLLWPCDGAPGLTYTDGAAADGSEHAETSVPRLPVSRETIAASWRRFPVARETDNAFRSREEEKRSGVEENQESGVEESQESGVEESQESGVEESQESGVEESQESGVEESQESGVEESQESGLKENQESGEKERTAQETLTRSPQASHDPGGSWLSKEEKRSGVEENQESGVEESQESGVEESQESGVEESQESGVEESQESGVEESQESGVEESQESGLKENQESGEKERTAQETLTRSPQASHDPGGSWLSKPTRRGGNERLIQEGPENNQT
ncbi:hypothetical protein NDU88_006165 [Pleurodeles waltl]|uniref:Uncharacterized protein n=1 Tax=Pleurodeles waltl TaxID=8319 RepID=A0AAV7MYF1_PLEWA|nr:hypothetical protein NDU88_006165 [Pleurodeles waltl]